jgi:hypothetical protein
MQTGPHALDGASEQASAGKLTTVIAPPDLT